MKFLAFIMLSILFISCGPEVSKESNIVQEKTLADSYPGGWNSLDGEWFLLVAKTLAGNDTDKGCGEFYYIKNIANDSEFIVCCMPDENKYNWYKINIETKTVESIAIDSSIKQPR